MTAITTAARLLRVAADELKNAHTLGGDWGNEHEALDAYNEHMATATTLEHMARQCLQQIEGPTTLAGTTIEQYARMFNAACEALGKISDCLGIDSDIDPGAEPIIAAIEQLRAGSTHPVLDDRWKARMLDGRAPERDEMGFGNHPELPSLDEGMMPRSFFAALGLELTHTSAEEQLDGDVLGAMSEAVNWTDWQPTAPQGKGWKLVSIFDTEDGPVAWWLRELPEAEDGTTTIRNLQAEVEKLEARIARLSRAGAAPAAVAPLPAVFEQIAQSWDGCMYDAPGETLDIGADIRAAAKRLLAEHPAAVAPQGDEDDSLLLCASDLQHSAIYDSHSEMQDCARSVADRIKALAARALAAPALEAPPAVTGRTVPRNDDERAAAQFFADNPGAALLAWPLYLARDKSLALEAPAAPADGATPGPWFVRKREVNGELRDCFVAAPDCQGLAYDACILCDDEYHDGMGRKLADCELIVAAVNQHRAALAAAPQAPAAPAVDAWLQPDDMAALQRFHETAEDDESYDIGKEAVARLCAFGCLQSHSFGRYSTTDFGDYLLDTWAGARTLPFTTAAERAAQAAAKGAAS